MKRVVVQELLDSDSGSPEEVVASLADLRWFNRWFGGASTTVSLIHSAANQLGLKRLTYLDVACASGDGALAAQKRLAAEGIDLQVTFLDRSQSHLRGERNGSRHSAITGDAMNLPFADNTFDLVGNSLFVHHLESLEVERFVTESLRVCRHAVIINDLRRSCLHWLTALAGTPLYRSRLTRHDAPASVRRAYTASELAHILERCPSRRVDFSSHYYFRTGVVIWKDSPQKQ